MWKSGVSRSRSRTSRPETSYACTRTVRLGFGWSATGRRVAARRSHRGPDCSRSTTGSCGDAMVTQIRPTAPSDVVRIAGQVLDQEVTLPGALTAQPVAYDGARGRLGDRDEGLVLRSEEHTSELQ